MFGLFCVVFGDEFEWWKLNQDGSLSFDTKLIETHLDKTQTHYLASRGTRFDEDEKLKIKKRDQEFG